MRDSDRDQHKTKHHKLINLFSLNRAIIFIIFLILAATAFFFTFEAPKDSLNSSPEQYLGDTEETVALNQYHKLIKGSKSHNKQQESEVGKNQKLFTEEYITQINFVDEIKYNFLARKKMLPALDRFLKTTQDQTIKLYIADLQELYNDNDLYGLDLVYDKYQALRNNLTKEIYAEKFKNSSMIKWLLQLVNIQIRGDAAIRAGGVEEVLERAHRALKVAHTKEAYDLVQGLENDYPNYVNAWLDYTKKYLKTRSDIENLDIYIRSSEYKKNFIKQCS